jgi:hypothetical protein
MGIFEEKKGCARIQQGRKSNSQIIFQDQRDFIQERQISKSNCITSKSINLLDRKAYEGNFFGEYYSTNEVGSRGRVRLPQAN